MDVSRFHDRLKNLQHLQQDTPDEWQTLSATYPYAAVVRQLSYVHTGFHNGKGNLSLLSLYKGDPLCFANIVQAVGSEQIEKTLQEDDVHSHTQITPDAAPQSESGEIVTDESDSSYPSEAEKSLIDIVDSTEVNEVQQIEIEQEDILELIQDLPNIPVFDLPDDIVEQYQEEMEITSVIEPDMDQQESEEAHIEKDKSLMVMMSFTDWLNHFKQKNTAEQEEDRSKKALKAVWQKEKLAEAADEELDEIPEPIFKQAMDSISSESDLVSETLADLHARQGNIEKAIAMYKKLSLRNPEKSTYFANRIQEITLKID
jgi:hypothetical protein